MKIGDAFGRALLDWNAGGDEPAIVERSDRFVMADQGPGLYFTPPRAWPSVERRGLRQMRGRVLDAGCGAGRLALALQDRGHDVVGIDVSRGAVKVCRKRGVRHVHELPVSRVRPALGQFDTIAMYGNNFGLVENPRRAVWLLRRFASITGPDGRIVAGIRDPYQTEDPAHLAYQRANRRGARMAGQVRLRIRYRELATLWFDYLLVSPPELRRIATAAGWSVTHLLEEDGPFYIAILEKATAPARRTTGRQT